MIKQTNPLRPYNFLIHEEFTLCVKCVLSETSDFPHTFLRICILFAFGTLCTEIFGCF